MLTGETLNIMDIIDTMDIDILPGVWYSDVT